MTPPPPTAMVLTPTAFLERSAVVFGDRTAVVDGGRRTTYADWLVRVRRMAGLLRGLGVRDGDRVAVLSPNTHLLLDAHYGVPLSGAVLVTLNIRLTPSELAYIVEHSGASVLLYDESLAGVAEQLPVATKLRSDAYESALGDAPEYGRAPDDEWAVMSLNYTSGTTGRPRGVMYHHRGAYLQSLAMAYHGRLDTSTVHLWTLPMFHCHGWAFTWAVTAAGGTHVCLPRVRPDAVWRLIADEGVTSLNAAPTVLVDLAADPGAARQEPPVEVGTGGAPPSPALLSRLADLGFRVTHLYGLTETFGPSVVSEVPTGLDAAPIAEQARFKARQGNANIAGSPIRVVDADFRDVPADGTTIGEIVVTGNTVALGYYRDEEATAESFGSGWFRTGDLGVMHPDFYAEIRDRAKDVIISGGENVASIEVEQALEQHPSVLEAAVVAAPHPRWGEVPVAFVNLADGAAVTDDDLLGFARTLLPGFKVPKALYRDELPKTGTGKIQKFRLRELARSRAPH